MSRLKILFIPRWYPHEENPIHGIFVKEYAKAAALYNDITVLFAYHSVYSMQKLSKVSEEVENDIKVVRIKYKKPQIPKARSLIYTWHILKAYSDLTRNGYRPDIIHAHVFRAGVPAVILGRLYKTPIIITEHYSAFPLRKLPLFDRLIARYALNRAQLILPVSNNLRQHIEAYGIKNKFQVVPNAVDTTTFYPQPSTSQPQHKVKRMLFVGHLIPRKGIPYLLEALNRVNQKRQDFHLDIVGDGPHRVEYEKLVTDLGLDKTVSFQGMKDKKGEIAEFMNRSDFLVLPSEGENLPCVLIEAMACGKPVIATKVGGIAEIINEKVGILVAPKDIGALAEAIQYMLTNCKSYHSENIVKHATENFSYKAVGFILDKIYHQVAG